MTAFSDFAEFDAVGLAELVRRRETTPLELVEAAIERIERYNPELNAVVTKLYDLGREQAEAALPVGSRVAGVPFLMKDLLSPVAGVRFTSGSRLNREL